MSEIHVNQQLLNRALRTREDMILSGEYIPPRDAQIVANNRDLSRLGRVCEEFTEAEIAIVITVAVRKYPQIVLKAILDELMEGETR